MFVREIMSTHVAQCTEDQSLRKIYEMIQESENDFVVVVDSLAHRVPIGIINEHSICEQVVGCGRNPRDLAAANVMESRITKIEDSATVESCLEFIDAKYLFPIIVLDRKRQLCGVLHKETLESYRKDHEADDDRFSTAGHSPYVSYMAGPDTSIGRQENVR